MFPARTLVLSHLTQPGRAWQAGVALGLGSGQASPILQSLGGPSGRGSWCGDVARQGGQEQDTKTQKKKKTKGRSH